MTSQGDIKDIYVKTDCIQPLRRMGIEYKTACQAWGPDRDVLIIQEQNGNILCQFPVEFLLRCEATQTLSFLRFVIRELLQLSLQDEIQLSHKDALYDTECGTAIEAGTYTYIAQSTGPVSLLAGPQGKSFSRPFRDTDGTSTVSRSSRSSVDQNKFRERLLARDGQCIATGDDDDENLVAAHIVPYSLGQEFLDKLTRYPRQITLFSVNNGLLLRPDLHQAFDRFRWGIYVDPTMRHFIHVFGESYHDLHGMEIHYRSRNPMKLPHIVLLRWQYQQCLMARIRGFHVPAQRVGCQ